SDGDPVGVDEVGQDPRGFADFRSRVGDDPEAGLVSLAGEAKKVGERDLSDHRFNQGEQVGDADEHLEAAAVSASAERPVTVDDDVADLAGRAAGPSQWLAAEDEPRPDAGRDLQVDDVGAALSCTP